MNHILYLFKNIKIFNTKQLLKRDMLYLKATRFYNKMTKLNLLFVIFVAICVQMLYGKVRKSKTHTHITEHAKKSAKVLIEASKTTNKISENKKQEWGV